VRVPRRLIPLLVGALALATVARATAAPNLTVVPAAAPPPFYLPVSGQVPGPAIWLRDFAKAMDQGVLAGVKAFYAFVYWSDIERAPGLVDLSGLDQVVVAAHDRGLELVLQYETCDFSLPQPAMTQGYRVNSQHLFPHLCAPTVIDAPVPAAVAMVKRYRPGGSLARERGWADWGVRSYEIENEPDAFLWVHGNYQTGPRDLALYLSTLVPAMRAAYPEVRIIAPALNTDDGADSGVTFLDRVLSIATRDMEWASDDYRSAVAAGAPVVGGGPFIDVYSYHLFDPDPRDPKHSSRPAAIRDIVRSHCRQPTFPSTCTPVLWQSESSPASYSGTDDAGKHRYTWAAMQSALQVLAAGVERTNIDFGAQGSDDIPTFMGSPVLAGFRVLTSAFPSAAVRDVSAEVSKVTGKTVRALRWSDEATGRRSTALWAPNDAKGSTAAPTSVSIALPVGTSSVRVTAPDFRTTTVQATAHHVALTLTTGDPSPITIVQEQGGISGATAAPVTTTKGTAGRAPKVSAPSRALAATGVDSGLAALAVLLLLSCAALRRRRSTGRQR
jgi:hypothetical protein